MTRTAAQLFVDARAIIRFGNSVALVTTFSRIDPIFLRPGSYSAAKRFSRSSATSAGSIAESVPQVMPVPE